MLACVLGAAVAVGSVAMAAPAGAAQASAGAASATPVYTADSSPIREARFSSDARFQASFTWASVNSGVRFVFWVNGRYAADLQNDISHYASKTNFTTDGGGSWVSPGAVLKSGDLVQVGIPTANNDVKTATILATRTYSPGADYTNATSPVTIASVTSRRVTGVAGKKETVDVWWTPPPGFGLSVGGASYPTDPATGAYSLELFQDIMPGSTVQVTAYNPTTHTVDSQARLVWGVATGTPLKETHTSASDPLKVTHLDENKVTGFAGTAETVSITWDTLAHYGFTSQRVTTDPVTGAFSIDTPFPIAPYSRVWVTAFDPLTSQTASEKQMVYRP